MGFDHPIRGSRKGTWSQPKLIPAIRSGNEGHELPAGNREIIAGAPLATWKVFFEPQSSAVVFVIDRELVSRGDSAFRALSDQVPILADLPLDWEDLVTRVRAAIRNSNDLTDSQAARFGDVRVDFASMEVTRLGKRALLTTQEFKTLKCFVMNPGRVISRDELLNEAWGYDSYPCTRTVDNHVLKLRQKLESDPANPVHFLTVHRAGYKFVP